MLFNFKMNIKYFRCFYIFYKSAIYFSIFFYCGMNYTLKCKPIYLHILYYILITYFSLILFLITHFYVKHSKQQFYFCVYQSLVYSFAQEFSHTKFNMPTKLPSLYYFICLQTTLTRKCFIHQRVQTCGKLVSLFCKQRLVLQ